MSSRQAVDHNEKIRCWTGSRFRVHKTRILWPLLVWENKTKRPDRELLRESLGQRRNQHNRLNTTNLCVSVRPEQPDGGERKMHFRPDRLHSSDTSRLMSFTFLPLYFMTDGYCRLSCPCLCHNKCNHNTGSQFVHWRSGMSVTFGLSRFEPCWSSASDAQTLKRGQ